jgi:hypothetical protein
VEPLGLPGEDLPEVLGVRLPVRGDPDIGPLDVPCSYVVRSAGDEVPFWGGLNVGVLEVPGRLAELLLPFCDGTDSMVPLIHETSLQGAVSVQLL